MSQFLGPIHHVMYDKICLVHGWEEACLARAEAAWGASRVVDLVAPKSGARWHPPTDDLARLIGDLPIHDWLQAAVNRAEASLAAVVAALLGHGDEAPVLLHGASFDHGRQTASDALQPSNGDDGPLVSLAAVLAGCYLDGMPCDQVSEVVEMGPRRLAVRRVLEIHRANWQAGGADPATMIALQGAWSSGLAVGVSPTIHHQREVKPVAGMLACLDTFAL